MLSKDDFVSSDGSYRFIKCTLSFPYLLCLGYRLNTYPSDYKLFYCTHMSGTTSLYFGKDLLVYCYTNNFSKCCFPDPLFFFF